MTIQDRKSILLACEDPAIRSDVSQKCKGSFLFWINSFAFTFEPRKTSKELPFLTWKHQDRVIGEITQAFKNGESILCEKSRDMGITVLGMAWILWNWLYQPGFSALVGSRKEDYVDKLGDINTLFGKIRYIYDRLPYWMRPKGFDVRIHGGFMRMINPENGASILGESANDDFGRQARASVVWLDEFNYWPSDESSWQAVSEVSPCKIVVSSVGGRHTAFARLRFKSNIRKIFVDWSEHPHKTQAWHDSLHTKGEMTRQAIASEIDRNYDAATGRPVYGDFTNDMEQPVEMATGRTWDFGYTRPAVVFLDTRNEDKVQVKGELLGLDINLHDWALIVQYVSGVKLEEEQIKRVAHLVETQHVEGVHNIAHLPHYSLPEGGYSDWCDAAGNQRSDKSPMTSIEILNSLNIFPQYRTARIDEGVNALRKLMIQNKFTLDPACVITKEALLGGYRMKDDKDEPQKDGYYDHICDAIRYFVHSKFKYFDWSKPEEPAVNATDPFNEARAALYKKGENTDVARIYEEIRRTNEEAADSSFSALS